jgi:hypothetical protein
VKTLFALVALLLAAPVAAEPARVTVTRQGDGFVADFRLPADAPAWGFWRSTTAAADNRSWRLKSWKVLTPGVTLQRRGQQDALVGTNGRPVPRHVRVSLSPYTGEVNANYVPALRLGGDSLALFDGHFSIFSAGLATLDTLPAGFDPAEAKIGDYGTAIIFKGKNLRLAGDVEGYRKGESAGTYGLFGVPDATVANGIATVVDSELPAWIAGDLAAFTPKVMGAMAARLGPAGVDQPTVLAAWEGGDRDGASMNGGTLKGLILMRFEGKAAFHELPALRNMARWFIAHEASHFWLGQKVDYASARDSWIMEGGADLLAVRTVSALDPAFDRTKVLNEALADCSKLAVRPVATSLERGEQRANYACGAVFALVAEKASKGDFYGFVRDLIAANAADRTVNSNEWLAALDARTGNGDASARIRRLLEQGSANAADDLAALLEQVGITFARDAKGVPRLS